MRRFLLSLLSTAAVLSLSMSDAYAQDTAPPPAIAPPPPMDPNAPGAPADPNAPAAAPAN
jgi:hypothetical protein